jgi:hypothetical protein
MPSPGKGGLRASFSCMVKIDHYALFLWKILWIPRHMILTIPPGRRARHRGARHVCAPSHMFSSLCPKCKRTHQNRCMSAASFANKRLSTGDRPGGAASDSIQARNPPKFFQLKYPKSGVWPLDFLAFLRSRITLRQPSARRGKPLAGCRLCQSASSASCLPSVSPEACACG